ncbi:conserved hypothetical protein [Anaerosphaera aminiphila DSM 21120]|uniref:YwbE family protein n=1 Tax=Anaerosphaera aminiphila DSM 21120 TaxID=1120995 RepID=A0A1M5PUN8_9FIRM|nr:YwbE family protein [Anaerosphaera aminiphila]SHH05316.1 conserved hypothetical protein [Anaerosphaera aminiphila DSM 21120]
MNPKERKNIKVGLHVNIIQKQDQRTGVKTEGIVERLLTNSSSHPHGIKVMIEGGTVGRVCDILESK